MKAMVIILFVQLLTDWFLGYLTFLLQI